MICNAHINTAPAPSCLDNLIIGTLAENNDTFNVMFSDTATGRVILATGLTDNAGLLTTDLTGINLPINHTFIVTASIIGEDLSATKDITIGAETAKEVYVTFVDTFGTDGAITSVVNYTLVLA